MYLEFIKSLASMKCGWIEGVRVLLGRTQNLVARGCVDHLDFLHSRNDILHDIVRLQELDTSTSFHSLINMSLITTILESDLCHDHKEQQHRTTEDLTSLLQKSGRSHERMNSAMT